MRIKLWELNVISHLRTLISVTSFLIISRDFLYFGSLEIQIYHVTKKHIFSLAAGYKVLKR